MLCVGCCSRGNDAARQKRCSCSGRHRHAHGRIPGILLRCSEQGGCPRRLLASLAAGPGSAVCCAERLDTGKACASMSVSLLGGSVFGYLFAVPTALMGGVVGAGVAVAAMVASLAWLVSVGLLAFAGYALVMAAVTGASVTAGGGFAVVLVGSLLCWGVAQVGVVVATGVFLRVGGESSCSALT